MSSSNDHGSESGGASTPPNNKNTNTNGPRLAPGGGAGGGGSKSNNKNKRRNNKAKEKKTQMTPRQKQPQQQQHRNRGTPRHHSPKKKNNRGPADMTVIVHRVDVWDIPAKAKACNDDNNKDELEHHRHNLHVAPYHFAPDVSCWIPEEKASNNSSRTVAIMRAPRSMGEHELFAHDDDETHRRWSVCESQVVDTTIPNPHPPQVVHDKYWAQRRRLFSRFDRGIQLDAEGWFSVTPQVIAHHVAARVGDLSNSTAFRRGLPGSNISDSHGIIVLDAFCGCGGNSIAFGKISCELISLVISVDVDRDKLRMAAHNANLYDIPKDKIIFVECSTMHIMEHCYKNGALVNDKNSGSHKNGAPCTVEREVYEGYSIGGLELLPDRIDAVFMDPPWGGVDYGMLGKDGYDLEKHMKIRVGPGVRESNNEGGDNHEAQPLAEDSAAVSGIGDDFFDTFSPGPKSNKTFTPSDSADGEYINGLDLLKMAAGTTKSRLVIYDMPRNTNKTSLGQAALAAGYRGNLKLEEYYLNGRLKTVTAYLGTDYSGLLR